MGYERLEVFDFNFISIKNPEEHKNVRLCFLSLCLEKKDGKWEINTR